MAIDPRTETLDAILGGRLQIVQPVAGYRFSIDALLLGSFAQPRHRDRVFELGAGCGIVAAMIATLRPSCEVIAVEVQEELAKLAHRNFAINRLSRATAIHADLCAQKIAGAEPGAFDYVVANPPWQGSQRGRESPNPSRHIARGAGGASLNEFVAAAARYCTNGGKVALIFAARRAAELLAELHANAFEPKRIRFVHPRIDGAANAVMVEASKGGGIEARIEPPLIVWGRPGVYTVEARAILETGAALAIASH